MSISIDSEGLDKLERELKSMEQGLKPETVDFWCKRIVNDVKLNASTETAERLMMEAMPNTNGNVKIKFSSPPELISLVVEVIRRYLPDMPITTRVFFEKFIDIVEEKLKK